jgi:hypothetical protein
MRLRRPSFSFFRRSLTLMLFHSPALTKLVSKHYLTEDVNKEDRQMWPYLQMWFPLYSTALGIAICAGVAAFIMSLGKPHA